MFEPEVERGAALLTAVRAGWVKEIDTVRLEMYVCEDCILGQLYGGFSKGLAALENATEASFSATEHGFMVPAPRTMERWEALTDAWRKAVRKRLKGT